MSKSVSLFFVLALLSLLASNPTQAQVAGSRSYTTISNITVTSLSNGVQIRIVADGILQYTNSDTSGLKMNLNFPDARNGTGKNFFNINRYPVSHVTVSTPQGATGGIGVQMQIVNFVVTNAAVTTTPDGQGVLVTVQSDRTIERRRGPSAGGTGGAAANATGKPDTSTEVVFEDKLLSLRAVRADIHELVASIAEKTGLSITVDDAVDRKVSLNLEAVEPAAAIQSIATAYGLALSRINDIYMISEGLPADLATYHLSGTASFRMQNTQAGTASGLLPNFLAFYVKVNPEQNAVVVTAPSQMLAKIGADLQKMDIPSPQILIEAIAVELSDTKDLDLGLSLFNQRTSNFSSINTDTGVINYNSIGKLPRNFEANLRALELTGKARVRARPQMAVVNGRSADIFIGAQRFILTQFNSFGQTQTRIQSVDVGVKLRVTPLTGGNGEITTRIAPEVSNITELDLQTQLPVLSSRRAETTVRVKDGETIAIGGLTLNQEQTSRRKIPFFGDIPVVGNLLRSTKKNRVQTELVVFVTPHILVAAPTSGPPANPSPAPPAPNAPAASAPTAPVTGAGTP